MLMKLLDPGRFAGIAQETSEYVAGDPGLDQFVDNLFMAFYELGDLVPQTEEKFWSGHFFPFATAQTELQNCGALAYMGFYQHAVAGLRWVLELGMLSVYWDRADRAESTIQPWLRSDDRTPVKNDIISALKEIPNVAQYAGRSRFVQEFTEVYEELSKYQHVRGIRYSSQFLSHGNVIRFQEHAIKLWIGLAYQVVRLVAAVHLLKYPIGLQNTPLDEKFGIGRPMGGLVSPEQADRLRKLFRDDELAALQEISDADSEACELAEQIRSMPDLTRDEQKEQHLRFAQSQIKNEGYQSWYEKRLQMYEAVNAGRDDHQDFREQAAALRVWAEGQGWLEHGRSRPPAGETGDGG